MSLENNGTVLEENTPSVPAEETATPVEETVAEEIPTVEEPIPAEAPVAEESPVEEASAPAEEVAPVATPAAPAKKAKKKHKKPHIVIRLLLQFLCLVLSLVLLVAVITTTVVADLRQVQSKDGIKQIITAFFEQPKVVRPVYGAVGMHMNSTDISSTDNDAVVDWLMEQIETQYGEELPVNREDVENFLEESTITDFVTDKFASYTEDFISGESTTTITTEEVKQLIDENKDLIQDTFGVEITDEITDTITDYVEEVDIDKVIKEEVFESIGNTSAGIPVPDIPNFDGFLPGVDFNLPNTENNTAGELTVNDLLAMLREITSDQVMNSAIGTCVVLALLLLLCNFYSLPGGLGWVSAPAILAGLLLSAPVYFILGSPETLVMLLDGQAVIADVITGVLATIAPVHYTVLGIGAGFAVLSIITRIIRAVIRKKKYA